MQINWKGMGKFEIKTKNAVIITGDEIQINGVAISNAGEYEVAGIRIEALNNIYRIEAEDLILAYLDKLNRNLTNEEEELLGATDIAFVPIGGKETLGPKEAITAVSQIEPKIIIPMHFENLAEFQKIESIQFEEADTLKITKAALPEEEKIIILKKSE